MIKLLIPIVLCAAAPAPAAPPVSPAPPATRTTTTRPAKLSPSELEALNVEAFSLMRQGELRKAAPLLEKVYKETPPPLRNRAFVLNHAIADVSQRTLVMRALKDLTEYLTKNRDPDEYATNVLGGTLNIAVATNPRLKSGALWQTALREWERRNHVLDYSRKGYRRWGTRWVTGEEFAQVQADIASLKQSVMDQAERAQRAYTRVLSLTQQYQNAVNERDGKVSVLNFLQGQGYGIRGGGNANMWDPNFMQPPQGQGASRLMEDALYAESEARRLGPEMAIAMKEFNYENRKLRELQAKVVRPEWPTKFEPVDPLSKEATTPPPLPAGDPTAASKPADGGLRPLPEPNRLK